MVGESLCITMEIGGTWNKEGQDLVKDWLILDTQTDEARSGPVSYIELNSGENMVRIWMHLHLNIRRPARHNEEGEHYTSLATTRGFDGLVPDSGGPHVSHGIDSDSCIVKPIYKYGTLQLGANYVDLEGEMARCQK